MGKKLALSNKVEVKPAQLINEFRPMVMCIVDREDIIEHVVKSVKTMAMYRSTIKDQNLTAAIANWARGHPIDKEYQDRINRVDALDASVELPGIGKKNELIAIPNYLGALSLLHKNEAKNAMKIIRLMALQLRAFGKYADTDIANYFGDEVRDALGGLVSAGGENITAFEGMYRAMDFLVNTINENLDSVPDDRAKSVIADPKTTPGLMIRFNRTNRALFDLEKILALAMGQVGTIRSSLMSKQKFTADLINYVRELGVIDQDNMLYINNAEALAENELAESQGKENSLPPMVNYIGAIIGLRKNEEEAGLKILRLMGLQWRAFAQAADTDLSNYFGNEVRKMFGGFVAVARQKYMGFDGIERSMDLMIKNIDKYFAAKAKEEGKSKGEGYFARKKRERLERAGLSPAAA